MFDALNDIMLGLEHKVSGPSCNDIEMAIYNRCSRVLDEVGIKCKRRDPYTDTIWRFDSESFCINALFKDRTLQMAGQAYHSPDVARLAASDMVKGFEYCPFNRNMITHFLICSRRERELFRIANEKGV